LVRRLREPVSPTEELEIPSTQLPPALVQQPTPAMPQTPYGMPVEMEAETVAPEAAPATGGSILPLLIGGAALLLLG
jgi:hypothetical protein